MGIGSEHEKSEECDRKMWVCFEISALAHQYYSAPTDSIVFVTQGLCLENLGSGILNQSAE